MTKKEYKLNCLLFRSVSKNGSHFKHRFLALSQHGE